MTSSLALFDLDHTLLPIDSDYEWGRYLMRRDAVDKVAFAARNADFFQQYQNGTLDPIAYLEFSLGTLASFPRSTLDALRDDFMHEVVSPALLPAARALLQRHRDAGDLIAIVTATNRFVTEPIAHALGVTHLLAAEPEQDADGRFTGRLLGVPTFGKGKLVHTENWLATMGKSIDSFNRSYFYSDSQNDLPLMSRVTHPVATNPNALLAAHAIAHGWPILNLFEEPDSDLSNNPGHEISQELNNQSNND
jgi:HAD superfamily hydrolase (TIGR01490 family)